MKKILFPTDFSECAYNAFEYALNFAAEMEAILIIYHVYHVPMLDAPVEGEGYQALMEQHLKDAEEELRAHEMKRKEFTSKHPIQHVTMEFELESGFAVDCIIEYSKKIKPDLIIMGTNGATGFQELLIGSNSASVIEKTKFPLMVVPGKASYHDINHIVYASDFDEHDYQTLKKLVSFSEVIQADITCVHISNKEKITDEVSMEELHELFWVEEMKDLVHFEIVDGEYVLDGLNDYAQKNHFDMIVMLKHKRTLFDKIFGKSITKKMAFHTNIPLLVYHEF